jgi:hypothetical protein
VALSHPPVGFGQRKDLRYLFLFSETISNIPTAVGKE